MFFTNSLEPSGLIQHFLHHPPEGFDLLISPEGCPGFYMNFNLLTTADADVMQRVMSWPAASLLRRLLTWRTLFFGSTVSEYLPLVAGLPVESQLQSMLATWRRSTGLCIVKDLPEQSPLLSAADNDAAARLMAACEQAGFMLVAGQALAYVPIDFVDEEDYLSRLSAGRRKDIRRKLRARAGLRTEIIVTGHARLNDSGFRAELYELYLEVYAQSEIHFDKLTADFFAAILQDASLDGRLLLYYADGGLIGFNLCFIHGGMLIDKYVGFRYPAARTYNLYFISWLDNLALARTLQLTHYVAGWTDPEIKAYLGARFTFTRHAVYLRNPFLRFLLGKLVRHFEHDKAWFEAQQR